MALTRITKAILGDEHSVLTVSAMLRGEYGQMDVFAGVPCIINQNGVQRVLPLSLTPEELEKLGSGACTGPLWKATRRPATSWPGRSPAW